MNMNLATFLIVEELLSVLGFSGLNMFETQQKCSEMKPFHLLVTPNTHISHLVRLFLVRINCRLFFFSL